jgi:hypothetical protein
VIVAGRELRKHGQRADRMAKACAAIRGEFQSDVYYELQ